MARMKRNLAFLQRRDGEKLPGLFARALIAIAGALGISLCAVSVYGLAVPVPMAALVAVISSAFFLVMLTSRKLGMVATGLFCAGAALALTNTVLLHRLARSFVHLYNAALLQLDSDKLPAAQLLTMTTSEVGANASEGTLASLIVIVFLSFMSALFLHGKVRVTPFAIMAGLLMALPFVANEVPPLWQWGILLSALVGAYAVRTHRVAASPYRHGEMGKVAHHRRYGASGMLAAVLCAVAFTLSMMLVPEDTHFAHEGLYDRAEALAMRVVERFQAATEDGVTFEKIKEMLARDSFDNVMGFQSGGRISIAAPHLNNREILQVDTNVDVPVFLRAGVGATFRGGAWERPTVPQSLAGYPGFMQTLELSHLGYPFPVAFREGDISLTYLAPTQAFFLPVMAEGPWADGARFVDDGAAVLPSVQIPPPFRAKLYAPVHSGWRLSYVEEYLEEYRLLMERHANEGGIYLSPLYDAFVRDTYLQVPPDLLAQVKQLSDLVTQGQKSDYAKTAAVCSFLFNNYAYSLEPQKSTQGLDDLRCFLFESKQGHCALYASSMALMLRAQGIPTRYITGFVAQGGADNILRERDYHAWTEVYFEGVGWLAFDPTGIAEPPAPAPETVPPRETMIETLEEITTAETTNPSDSPAVTSTEETTLPDTPAPEARKPFPLWILLLPVALASLVGAGILARKRLLRAERASRTRRTRGNPGRATTLLYGDILLLLSLEGFSPRAGELFPTFASRVDGAFPLEGSALGALTGILERREFGRAQVSEEERASVLAYRDALLASLRAKRAPWSKLWMRLRLLEQKR